MSEFAVQPAHSTQPATSSPRMVLGAGVGPISLTQFYPFALADPLTKRAELRAIRASHGVYTPALDYWRLLRLQVVSHHRYTPGHGLDALDTAIELAHPSREANYRLAVANYRRLIGHRWVERLGRPMRALWEAEGLANPLVYLLQRFHGRLGRPIVFDVLRGRAFGLTRPNVDYEGLLRAQAAAFVSLWQSEDAPVHEPEEPLAA